MISKLFSTTATTVLNSKIYRINTVSHCSSEKSELLSKFNEVCIQYLQ